MNMFTGLKGPRGPNKKLVIRREVTTRGSPKVRSASEESARKQNSQIQVEQKSRQIRDVLSVKKHKRRIGSTSQPLFSDDEGSATTDNLQSDSDVSYKRAKLTATSCPVRTTKRRQLVRLSSFKERVQCDIIHGATATSGNTAEKYTNPWNTEDLEIVVLRYPSNSAGERFELTWPIDERDEYKPMEDIIETVKHIIAFYFPEESRRLHSDDANGFARRFTRAWQRRDLADFVTIINEFNTVVEQLLCHGLIQHELESRTEVHIDLIRRILDQVYSRVVSPKVDTLRAYQNGSDNVYGELFPRFVSDILTRTRLNHEQMFLDLGSGVGNVVLQAALEVGCESWGIEVMKNPCDLAILQAQEFDARTRLWGLQAGTVHLLEGDMTEHDQVPDLLRRADVILVNNQAFTPQLNDQLSSLFLDLKEGAQVVSLKPFVPEGHKMAVRNIDSVVNQFVQQKFEYFSDSVSWSHYGNAYWYIARKDLRPLNKYRRQMNLDQ